MGRFDGVPLRDGDVQFRLAGEDWRIRYGRIAWLRLKLALKVATERKCLEMVAKDEAALMSLLHVGFAVYHPDVTYERAVQLFDVIPRPGERDLDGAAWEAIGIAMPAVKALADLATKNGSGSDTKEQVAPQKIKTRKRSTRKR